MKRHQTAEAPHYVNTAHRAALMYAFAAQLLAVFAATSAFSGTVKTIAVIFPLLFFGIAIFHYINLGLTAQSNNSMRASSDRTKDYPQYLCGGGDRPLFRAAVGFLFAHMGLNN